MMSVLLLGTSTCFICAETIARRVDAAKLLYASPDDIGEVARHGRAWAHRRCWRSWSVRPSWAASSLRLATARQGVVSIRDVFALRTLDGVIATDVQAPFEWPIPLELIAAVRDAFEQPPRAIVVDRVHCELTHAGAGLALQTSLEGALIDRVELDDPEAWAGLLGTFVH